MSSIHLRDATASDLPVLRRALLHAAYWRPGEAPESVSAALDRPDLRYLLLDWGRPGDCGVVAEAAGRPVGAAWYRYWTEELHSYGFVDESTPELAVGVLPEERSRGVGTALLRRLLAVAAAAGVVRLSLSVEIDNPARRLYERLGFREVVAIDGAATLVVSTDVEAATPGR